MQITLLHNPTSGTGRPSRSELEQLLLRHGHQVRYWSSKQDEELEKAVDELVERLAAAPTVVVGLTKRCIHRSLESSLARVRSQTIGSKGERKVVTAGCSRSAAISRAKARFSV